MSPARRVLPWLSCGLLLAGLIGLEITSLLEWAAIALVLLTALRLREARRVGAKPSAMRQVALLQLISAGLLAALQSELGPSLLQLAATVTALAGLLAEEVGDRAGLRQVLQRSLGLLAAALPMALFALLLLPRFGPLLPRAGGAAQTGATGLSEQLEPGRLAELAANNAPAARLSWQSGYPPAASDRYWRVLVHRHFDGRRWLHRREPATAGAGAPIPAGAGSQFWLVEANNLSAVPWSGSGQPEGATLRQLGSGELHDSRPADQRRSYSVRETAQPAAWQRQPPTAADLALPAGLHPRLEALGASWRNQGPPRGRLKRAEAWFRARPFRYTTRPGPLPARAGLDVFLFERRQGFCGHYASAFTALMRAAGVPARVVSGYLGGTWVQPLGGEGYLDLRQGNAHAWSEVWLPQQGWVLVDPTTWVPPERRQARLLAGVGGRTSTLLWLQRQWWGLDLAWSRWWQGFDRQAQERLLQRLLGDRRRWVAPLLLGALGLSLAGGVVALRHRPGRQGRDRARQELERVLLALDRAGIKPHPGDTLEDLAERASRQRPELTGTLQVFIAAYRQWRFASQPAPQLRKLQSSRRQLVQALAPPPNRNRDQSPPGLH